MNEHQFLNLSNINSQKKQSYQQQKNIQEQFHTPRLNKGQSGSSKNIQIKSKSKTVLNMRSNDDSFQSFEDQTVLIEDSQTNNNQVNLKKSQKFNTLIQSSDLKSKCQQDSAQQEMKYENIQSQNNQKNNEYEVNLLDSPQNWKQSSHHKNSDHNFKQSYQNNESQYQNYVTQLEVSALIQKSATFVDEQSQQNINLLKTQIQEVNDKKQLQQNQENLYRKQNQQEKYYPNSPQADDKQFQQEKYLQQFNDNEGMDLIQQEFQQKLNKIRQLKMQIFQQKNILPNTQLKDFQNNEFILAENEQYQDQNYVKSSQKLQENDKIYQQNQDHANYNKAPSQNQNQKYYYQQQYSQKEEEQKLPFPQQNISVNQIQQNKIAQISQIQISNVEHKQSVSLQNQSHSQIACYNQNNFQIESSNSGRYLFQSSNSKNNQKSCQFKPQLMILQRNVQQHIQIIQIKDPSVDEKKSKEQLVRKNIDNSLQNKASIIQSSETHIIKSQLMKEEYKLKCFNIKQSMVQKQQKIKIQLFELKRQHQTFSYQIQQQFFSFEQFFSEFKQQLAFSLFALISNTNQNVKRMVQQQYQQQIEIIKQDYEYQIQQLAKQYQQKLKIHFDSSDGPSIVHKQILKNNSQEQYEQVLADLSLQKQSLYQQLNLQHQHNQILFIQNQKFKKNYKQFQTLQQKYQELSLNNQKLTQYIFQSQQKICCLKKELQKFQNDRQMFYLQIQQQITKSKQQQITKLKIQFQEEKQTFIIQIKNLKQISKQLKSKVNFLQTKLKQAEISSKSQSQISSSQSESQKSIQKLQLKNYQFQLKQYEIRLAQSQSHLQQSRVQYFNVKQELLKKQHELNIKTSNLKQQTQQLQRLRQYVSSLQKRESSLSLKLQQISQQLSQKQTHCQDLKIQLQKIQDEYQALQLSTLIKSKRLPLNQENNSMNYTNLGTSQVQTYNAKNNFFRKSDVLVSSGTSFIQKRLIQKKQQLSSLKDLFSQQKYQKPFNEGNRRIQKRQNDFINIDSKNNVSYQSGTIFVQNTDRNSFCNSNWNNSNKQPLDTQQSVNRILESIRLKKSQVSNSCSIWNNQSSQTKSFEKQSLIKPKSPSSNNKQIEQLKDTKMKHISQKLEKLRSDIRSQIKQLKK